MHLVIRCCVALFLLAATNVMGGALLGVRDQRACLRAAYLAVQRGGTVDCIDDGTQTNYTITASWPITLAEMATVTDAMLDAEASAPRVEPNGVQAPIYYVPDATGSNGVALVAVSNALVVVDGWGSPRHTLERARADAAKLDATNSTIGVDLRLLRDAIATNINDAQSIDPSVWTGAQRTQAQAIRRELIDALQTQREIVRLLRAMRKEYEP